jgi:two-component SAPR family response regulator
LSAGPNRLAGCRILIVEDDFLVAKFLAAELTANGAEIIGPVGTVKDSLVLIAGGVRIDGAVLDVNLHGELVYPVADVLRAKGVHTVFLTGYDKISAAASFANAPWLQKPVMVEQLLQALKR